MTSRDEMDCEKAHSSNISTFEISGRETVFLSFNFRFCEVTVNVTLHNCSSFTLVAFVEMLADRLER